MRKINWIVFGSFSQGSALHPFRGIFEKRPLKKTLKTFCVLVLMISCMMIFLAGCSEGAREEVYINPLPESAASDKVLTRLYFGYRDEHLLSGEGREITVPMNGRIETAVLAALIEGPKTAQELTPLIAHDTKVVNVSVSGEFVFLTLSKEFLTYPDIAGLSEGTKEYESAMAQRRLAVYSIVNTITELGQYSRVQILVDYDATGRGQRISRAEMGFSNESDTTLEPLMRDSDLILNPKNAAEKALNAYSKKDWEQLFNMIALKDSMGDKPEKEEFMRNTVSFDAGLLSFSVLEVSVSPGGKEATVMVSYTYRPRQGDTFNKINVPLRLVEENSVWKLSYYSLNKLTDIT